MEPPKGFRFKTTAKRYRKEPDHPRNSKFFSEDERTQRLAKFSDRPLQERRWMNFGWLTNQGFDFHFRLISQNLQRFCEFTHDVYTNCVREFFANFTKNSFGYQSWVNGVHFFIEYEDFALLFGMPTSGLCLSGNADSDVLDVDVSTVYWACLSNKADAGKKNRAVGGMKIPERLLFWTIAHVLLPKSGNVGYPTDTDLKYLFAIQEGLDVNWAKVILHQFLKVSESEGNSKLPFGMLVSQILVMKNVPIPIDEDVLSDSAADCCLNSKLLKASDIWRHPRRGWMTKAEFKEACEEDEAEKRKMKGKGTSKGKGKATSDDFDMKTEMQTLKSDLIDHIDAKFAELKEELKFGRN